MLFISMGLTNEIEQQANVVDEINKLTTAADGPEIAFVYRMHVHKMRN